MKAKLTTRTLQTLEPSTKPYDVRDADLAGFLLRVLPSGSMTYFCDYRRPDGRRTRLKIGDAAVLTPAQARDEAIKVLADRVRGDDPARNRKAQRQLTLAVFIEKHYRPWAESHRKTGASTANRSLTAFNEFLTCQLSNISPWRLEKWRAARIKSGTASSTVNRNVTMLKSMLQKAVEWGMVEANPIAKVRPLKVDQAAKIRYLDLDEEQRLHAALDQREVRLRSERQTYNQWLDQRGLAPYPDLTRCDFADYLRPMVLLSLNTGIRRGELFSLTWSDIDFQRNTMTINGFTAKSGKTRHIPLNQGALQTLVRWKGQSDLANELVFPSPTGGRFDNVSTSWEGLLQSAEIQDFRWHDLRHHFASSLVMKGVDLNTIRELLGHSDLKMTLRYAHLAPQVKADAVAKLDRVILHPEFRIGDISAIMRR